MTFDIIYHELQSLSNQQTYNTFKKHGAKDNIFGVQIGSIRKLAKKYKINHPVALLLWDTGMMEARCLAVLLADAKQVSESLLDSWVEDIDFYYLSELFAKELVFFTPFSKTKTYEWSKSSKEYVKRVSYDLLSRLCKSSKQIKNEELLYFLSRIGEEILISPNRAKQSMNIALINIGSRNTQLHEYAINIAKKIGTLDLDLGETACKNYNAYEELSKIY